MYHIKIKSSLITNYYYYNIFIEKRKYVNVILIEFMLFNDLSRLIQKNLKYKLRNVRKSLYLKAF